MPAIVNTNTTLGNITRGYLRTKLLSEGQLQNMLFGMLGQADPQPKNQTTTAYWRRITNLPVANAKVAIQEGRTPPPTKLNIETVSCSLEQVGAWVPLTDRMMTVNELNKGGALRTKLGKMLGQQAAEVLEERRADVLKAGSHVRYAGGSVTARASVNAAISLNDLRSVQRTLERARAQKIKEVIKPAIEYGTQAIERAFVLVGHPDLLPSFRALQGWVSYAQYPPKGPQLPGEVGSCEGFRICTHDVLKPWVAAGANGTTSFLSNGDTAGASDAYDVYPVLALAMDAFGIVPLAGESKDDVEILFNAPGTPTHGNELGLNGSIGWVKWDGCVRLNESFMHRIECCAPAL